MIARCFDPAVAERITTLLNQELGDDCHTVEEIVEMITSDRAVVVTAVENGEIVGAATGLILQGGDPESWLVEALENAGEHFDGPVGLLQSTAVEPDWRRRGIGSELATQRIDLLRELGSVAIGAFSWESGQPGRSRPVLERLGFKLVARFDSAWPGQPCPVCVFDCRCGASLMVLR